MMDIWGYPVKYKYGYSDAYGPTFHTGEDRPAPLGTPVTVNSVVIGLVGSTGKSTGNHLHVGRWVGGSHTNPGGGGKIVSGGTVTQVDTVGSTNNGKFVRVADADGSKWVYLHLSEVKVTVGQKLTGGEAMINDADNEFARWNKLFFQIRGRNASREEFQKNAVGLNWLRAMEILSDDPEADRATASQQAGLAVPELQKQLAEVRQVLANEQAKPPREVVREVEKIVEKQVEVIKEVPVYVHDQATKDNVNSILKVVLSIKGLVLNLFKKFKKG